MEAGKARSPRAPQPDQAATPGKKNPAPFDKVRDRNLEDQRSRSLGDQLVPRKGLGFRETNSLSINVLGSLAETPVYHVCVVAFNGSPFTESSDIRPSNSLQSLVVRTSLRHIGAYAKPLTGTGLHR